MAEQKFEVGQEVIATENLYLITDEVVLKGAKGKVVGHDRQQLAKVRFVGMSWDVSVWGTSIAPTAPDAGSGADDYVGVMGADDKGLWIGSVKRGDLFTRVQEVLDLALFYLPGELGEFPDKVQQTVADFKNYRNLAEKQIQERDAQLAAAQEREKALAAALEPFAEAWLQVPFGLRSVLRIWNGRTGEESGYDAIGLGTDHLQDAHTAYFNLAPDAGE